MHPLFGKRAILPGLLSVRDRRRLTAGLMAALLMVGLIWWVGYRADRSDFASLIGAFTGLWVAYVVLMALGRRGTLPYRQLVGLGVLLRVLLLFSLPTLSDDVYRFLWDGHLLAQGIHPFAFTPQQALQQGLVTGEFALELFERLNSPQYYTVYPPVCQGVFALAALIFPTDMSGGIWGVKLFLLTMELAALWSLWRLPAGPKAAAVYALNPLVLVEVMGNAHFEGAVVAFLLVGWLLLRRQRCLSGALFWALAIATKLLPLLFLPVLWLHLNRRTRWKFLGGVVLFCAALFAPLADVEALAHLFSSLRLYFQQFTFNAGVYYALKGLLKAIGQEAFLQARLLGPLLGFLTMLGVWAIALYRPTRSLVLSVEERLVLTVALYLLLSATVHPWYVIVPFGLSQVSDAARQWRFPLVWSAVIALSYSHYADGGFQEKYPYIVLEYVAVGAALKWDIYRKRFSPKAPLSTSQVFG